MRLALRPVAFLFCEICGNSPCNSLPTVLFERASLRRSPCMRQREVKKRWVFANFVHFELAFHSLDCSLNRVSHQGNCSATRFDRSNNTLAPSKLSIKRCIELGCLHCGSKPSKT